MSRRQRHGALSALPFLTLLAPASSFYLPGMAPTSYGKGDSVPLYVNRLRPFGFDDAGSVNSVMSFDYYSPEFHFCKPEGGPTSVPESLGSILFGDRIYTSAFDLKMMVEENCKAICPDALPVTFSESDSKIVNTRILQSYLIDWLVDGLPAMYRPNPSNPDIPIVFTGFPLGVVDSTTVTPLLNNHFDLVIEYHQAADNEYRVVGFEVDPYSHRDNKVENGIPYCGSRKESRGVALSESGDTQVTWTYSVKWRESNTVFATRWDKYLHVIDPKIHWFWLINSAIFVCLLVAMVSSILVRTLRKDIARYSRLDEVALEDFGGNGVIEEGVQEDSGWKLVHGDVFRPPKLPLPLSVLIGNGTQLFLMTGFTIAFALFGFLSPSNRGALGTAIIIFYTFSGFAGGYVSSRVYKFMNGEGWKRNFIYTPVCLPASVFALFFFVNLFLWGRGGSGAVPFGTMLVLVLLWFVISLPFSLAGSWLGFKAQAVQAPTRTNQIPRQIPYSGSTYLKPIPGALAAGILPFTAISVELSFIMSSLWSGRIYYMFGFLFLCFGLMVMMCATVTILLVYVALCAENYHWQWRAFFSAGATGFYVFLYALFHWMKYLSLSSLTGVVLYLGYSFLMSVLVFILTGTIGFLSVWMFTLKIYGSIKVD